MTWDSAKQDALKRIEIMLQGKDPGGIQIALSDYNSEETFRFLTGQEDEWKDWSFGYFKMVNRAVARELRARGAKVARAEIELQPFLDWLTKNNEKNSPASRAMYVAEVVAKRAAEKASKKLQ